VDAVERGWTYTATLMEGEDFPLFIVTIDNPGADAEVLFNAGTAFAGPDDIQPAVVTEDLMVFVPAGRSQEVILSNACGAAMAMSGSTGTEYEEGVYLISEELARVLDRVNEELIDPGMAVQDLVWVYTDDHDFASVYVDDSDQPMLMEILGEEVQDFAEPGYAIQYREPDPDDGRRFSGEAMEARCEVHVNLPRAMSCRVVLLQPDGERLEMMTGVDMSTGRHAFFLTIGLEGYPPGDYTLQLEGERFGQTLYSRDLHLQGRG
jgi:hypothetical protein